MLENTMKIKKKYPSEISRRLSKNEGAPAKACQHWEKKLILAFLAKLECCHLAQTRPFYFCLSVF